MGTLIYNVPETAGKKPRKQKQSQLEKLQIGLRTQDLTLVTYTGKCDMAGGECACGKRNIVYRFFVQNPDGEIFVVGSECINHFLKSTQNEIRVHEKQLKAAARKKAQDEIEAYKENAEHDFCIGLNKELQELCSHPLLVGNSNIEHLDFNCITRRRAYYYDRLKVFREILKQKQQ